jgi:hypothetical protein
MDEAKIKASQIILFVVWCRITGTYMADNFSWSTEVEKRKKPCSNRLKKQQKQW